MTGVSFYLHNDPVVSMHVRTKMGLVVNVEIILVECLNPKFFLNTIYSQCSFRNASRVHATVTSLVVRLSSGSDSQIKLKCCMNKHYIRTNKTYDFLFEVYVVWLLYKITEISMAIKLTHFDSLR